ncbi:putative transporter C11D3.18C like protein [Verticillium longisporum]|nr:putative transporter C11D3.18C like protein [Verticillium longisporum]
MSTKERIPDGADAPKSDKNSSSDAAAVPPPTDGEVNPNSSREADRNRHLDQSLAEILVTDDAVAATAEARRKSLVRKYDIRLMPVCFITFLFFFLDKANIALARINGLEEDLGLTSIQFNIALMLFFILNILFNIPGNLALRLVGGGNWLPLLIVSWGIVTTLTGFVTSFGGLCVTRVFLGLAESSFMGGVLIYLGFFYTPDELISRVGIFYSSAPLAGSVGGLLAGGLGRVRLNGYNGWPWIFFIEGALTVILGIVAYCFLPNTPRDTRSLTDRERTLALRRMHINPDEKPAKDHLQFKTVKRAIFNFMTLIMSIGAFFSIEAIYSYALFLPTIVQTMGFKSLQASLMTVPPNFVGFLFTLGICCWSRHIRRTALPLNVCCILGIIGFVLLLVGGQTGSGPMKVSAPVQYTGTFFVAMSVNALPPLALTWMTINARPHYVRAIALGFVLTVGNLAAFLASFTYIKTEAPAYIRGHAINLGCLTGLLAIGIITPLWMRSENHKRDRGERDHRLDEARWVAAGQTKEQYELQLGWLHPGYRYKI